MANGTGPIFSPSESGDDEHRIRRVENHLLEFGTWVRGCFRSTKGDADDLCGRLTTQEEKMATALQAIGALKVRLGFVMFLGGVLGGTIVAVAQFIILRALGG